MKIQTYNDDLLGRKSFGDRLAKFIEIEQTFVDQSLVISLNGSFGSGKSTFLSMWKESLQSDKSSKQEIIHLNAWEDDYCQEPLLSLIHSIVSVFNKGSTKTSDLVEAINDCVAFSWAIGKQMAKWSGLDPEAAGKEAANKSKLRAGLAPNLFEVFETRKKAVATLKSSLTKALAEHNKCIWILIDELDRCKPDYAIAYLETIKHIFDIPNLVFVLAVDREQLKNTAQSMFGAGLNFTEYYRKFVHREVTLPQIDERNYGNLVHKYLNTYLQRQDKRACSLELDTYLSDRLCLLVQNLKLTPRQLEEAFRIAGHALSTDEVNRKKIHWVIGNATIMMSLLRQKNPQEYKALADGTLSVKQAQSIFTFEKKQSSRWWVKLIFAGKGFHEIHNINSLLLEMNIKEDRPYGHEEFVDGWDGKTFSTIHQMLEETVQWFPQ